MHYQTEDLGPDLVKELASLILSLFAEVGDGYDMDPDPDWEQYMAIQSAGLLKMYTVRNEGALIGFSLYILAPMLHHKGIQLAMQDTIFLLPNYRSTEVGGNLLKYAEERVRVLGIDYITAVTKIEFDFSSLLKRTGYVAQECAYIKKLKQ